MHSPLKKNPICVWKLAQYQTWVQSWTTDIKELLQEIHQQSADFHHS